MRPRALGCLARLFRAPTPLSPHAHSRALLHQPTHRPTTHSRYTPEVCKPPAHCPTCECIVQAGVMDPATLGELLAMATWEWGDVVLRGKAWGVPRARPLSRTSAQSHPLLPPAQISWTRSTCHSSSSSPPSCSSSSSCSLPTATSPTGESPLERSKPAAVGARRGGGIWASRQPPLVRFPPLLPSQPPSLPSRFNTFDAIIVLLAYVEMAGDGGGAMSVLRMLRVLRLLKVRWDRLVIVTLGFELLVRLVLRVPFSPPPLADVPFALLPSQTPPLSPPPRHPPSPPYLLCLTF